MANTKSHPGAFRCYEAALPDEPMFVILGRDPAGPATLEFWATQRVKTDKVHTKEDQDRIRVAIDEAQDMASWRERHLDPMGDGVPAWKLPRPADLDDRPPVRDGDTVPRAEYEALRERARALVAETRDCTFDPPAFKAWNKLGQLVGYGERKTEQTEPPVATLRTPDSTHAFCFDRPNAERTTIQIGESAEIIPLATLVDHYMLTNRKSHYWSPGPDLDNIEVTPLSFTRMSELLDYATCYGEFDENTPNGTISKYGEQMSSPMNDIRRHAIWVMKRFMGIIPEGAIPPQSSDQPLLSDPGTLNAVVEQIKLLRQSMCADGRLRSPGAAKRHTSELRLLDHLEHLILTGSLPEDDSDEAEPWDGDRIDALHDRALRLAMNDQRKEPLKALVRELGFEKLGDLLTCKDPATYDRFERRMDQMEGWPEGGPVDSINGKPTSRDVTEIDQPEMPPHRFAMFDKGKGWAYGRGLEISPAHIPAMLDRMEEDGYTLVAALGSQADKVGMIFQRGPRFTSFELAHGFGLPNTAPVAVDPRMQAFESGKPLGEIDMGRGCEP